MLATNEVIKLLERCIELILMFDYQRVTRGELSLYLIASKIDMVQTLK